MKGRTITAFLLVLAALSAGAWLWLSSQPGFGYALVQAYGLVAGTPTTVSGSDGITLALLVLSRPLMWLLLGYAIAAAVVPRWRTFSPVSLVVLMVLLVASIAMQQTIGVALLGLSDSTLLGGIAFVLPGVLSIVGQRGQ